MENCILTLSSDEFTSDAESDPSSEEFQEVTGHECTGCRNTILDRYLLMVDEKPWHSTCLKCSMCKVELHRHQSCFLKNGNIYCRNDYYNLFGAKCGKCLSRIESSDWVRRANDSLFHLACFSCYVCKRQLSTGDEIALHDSRLLCKTHYIQLVENGCDVENLEEKPKPKRIRTAFSDDQVQLLHQSFKMEKNPDGPSLDRIGHMVGLNKRVVQVWFQNARAKQKKQKYQNESVSSPDSFCSENSFLSDI